MANEITQDHRQELDSAHGRMSTFRHAKMISSAECAERDHEENTHWFDLAFHIGLTFLNVLMRKINLAEVTTLRL